MKLKYKYRMATPEDWVNIVEFVAKPNYFFTVEPSQLGGLWFLAEIDGEIKATVWCFHQGPNAYIDYWTGDKIASVMLLLYLKQTFEKSGIRYVRGTFHKDNKAAHRIITDGFGCITSSDQHFFFKDLNYGTENNDSDQHAPGEDRTGKSDTRPAAKNRRRSGQPDGRSI